MYITSLLMFAKNICCAVWSDCRMLNMLDFKNNNNKTLIKKDLVLILFIQIFYIKSGAAH